MLNPGEFKRGQIIDIDGHPCLIEKIIMQTPSSRGGNTIWKVRARNLRTKQKVDKPFRSGDTASEPDFEKRHVQFLYRATSDLHFMDMDSYDQFALPIDGYSEEAGYLTDNLEGIRSLVLEDEVIGIEMPQTGDIVITECDPAVKGNSPGRFSSRR